MRNKFSQIVDEYGDYVKFGRDLRIPIHWVKNWCEGNFNNKERALIKISNLTKLTLDELFNVDTGISDDS